jgi:hypothetical protein
VSPRIGSESSYPFAGDQRAIEKTTDPIRFLRHLALVGTIALSMATLHQNGIVPKGILPELDNCSWLRTLARRERLLWHISAVGNQILGVRFREIIVDGYC